MRRKLKFSFKKRGGIFWVTLTHDGVTKKMSHHFFQYSCGFAGFLELKIQSDFP